MTRTMKKNTTLKALAILIGAGSLALTGCGSDLSTAPTFGTNAQDQPGEVILPTKDYKVESPRGFEAELMGGEAVNLTWAVPSQSNLTAIITIDGVELARVPADNGAFLDTIGKPAGDHVYDLCFKRGARGGRHAQAMVEIRESGGGNDGGRTDKRPENG